MIIRWIPNWVIGTCRARIRGRGSAGQAGAWAAIAGLLALQVYCARLGGQHWSSWLLPFMGRLGRPHDSLGDQRGWTAGMADASVRRISRSPSAWIAKTFPARRVPSPASTAAAASRSATNQVIRAVPAAADSSATRSGPVRKLQRPPGEAPRITVQASVSRAARISVTFWRASAPPPAAERLAARTALSCDPG